MRLADFSPSQFSGAYWAVVPDAPSLALPLDPCGVSAGFPSPAQDYEEGRLDIHEYLLRNPVSTFYFRVSGASMEGAHLFDGDVLVVDKSISPVHGHIVVAFVGGERLVKRLYKQGGRVALVAENLAYPPLVVTEEMGLEIWSVVIGCFRRIPA